MDYSTMIDNIMPLVQSGDSDQTFILSRKDDEWEIDYLGVSPDKYDDYVDAIREYDPCALMFTGADFSRGSYSYVYDKVFTARIDEEFAYSANSGEYSGKIRFFADFVTQNISMFSPEVTEHLTRLDRPLAAICQMDIPVRYVFDDDNEYELIEAIESGIAQLHNHKNVEIMENMTAKRSIEGYSELSSVQLAGSIVILAEKPGDNEQYMVVNCRWDNPFYAEEYFDAAVTPDYLEAVGEYINRQSTLLTQLEAERSESGLPLQTLTTADCIPGAMNDNLTGKVIVIKPEYLSPEYRTDIYQLKICTGGNGARPDARGNAVFCREVFSGKESRFERPEVAGVIDPAKLPEWAKLKLAEIQDDSKEAVATPDMTPKKERAKKSVFDALDKGKEKVAKADTVRSGQSDKPQTRRRGGQEHGD